MNDYYAVLGVTPEADTKLIKAAYKVMSNQYHPDKNASSTTHEKMTQINEAYSVLSDPQKRAKYDAQWESQEGSHSFQDNDEPNNGYSHSDYINDTAEDWAMAVQIYPELDDKYQELKSISKALAVSFRLATIETREFHNFRQTASDLKDNFVKRYFGPNEAIQRLALDYIRDGNRAAAKEINKLAVFFGQSIDYGRVSKSIVEKHGKTSNMKKADSTSREQRDREWKRRQAEEKRHAELIEAQERRQAETVEKGPLVFKLIAFSMAALIAYAFIRAS